VGRSRLIIDTFGWLPMRPRSSRRPVVGVDLAAIPMEDACRLIASVDPSEVTPSFMSPRVGHAFRGKASRYHVRLRGAGRCW
jgi:hypothetical protein